VIPIPFSDSSDRAECGDSGRPESPRTARSDESESGLLGKALAWASGLLVMYFIGRIAPTLFALIRLAPRPA